MTATEPPERPNVHHGRRLLGEMVRVRRFEEACAEQYSAQKIRGFLHLAIGEEAVAAGAMQALRKEDAVVATYREHGHALARGIPADRLMAEMFGKASGVSGGRGGSMHVFDAEHNFYGGNAIVGGGLPLATGLALGRKLGAKPGVAACFFGEGAMAEGEFHEAVNLAVLWRLPVLFLCENNLYAMGTALDRSESETDLVAKAASYGVHAEAVDGMDVLAVEAATRAAADRARAGEGPSFLELKTYRYRAHSMFDAERYREKGEVEEWKRRDPIDRLREQLYRWDMLDEAGYEAIVAGADKEVAAAVAFAEAAEFEPVADLAKHTVSEPGHASVSEPVPAVTAGEAGAAGPTTYREALRAAMTAAMDADERVFLMGEDVGRYGGCFAVSMGMLERFGEERVRDTPLSESAFTGAGIGAAMAGLRPIVEIMTVNFSLLALDQIINTAATFLHMSGGQFNVPLLIRMTTGGGKQLAAQHSHSLEGWYAHIPGLRIVAPATVPDAYGMVLAGLASPDPVLLFEHGLLYNAKGELPADTGAADLDRAAVRRPGQDVSIFTYGGSLPKAMAAAEELAAEGIEAEVVDLRTLRPLDEATILASVARTHRAVVVDEGWKSGGIGAEILARIAEHGLYELDAPPARVATAEVPIPYPHHLEQAALPQAGRIVAAVKELLGRG